MKPIAGCIESAPLSDAIAEDELYQQVEAFVEASFTPGHHSVLHLQRTVHWLKVLRPSADMALVIAALTHDLQRSEHSNPLVMDKKRVEFMTPEFLDYHQTRGAQIIGDFLSTFGAAPAFIDRVKLLVGHHETGGDTDQDLLKDADSLSFLENCVDYFLEHAIPIYGAEVVLAKLNWMFERISSTQATALARPMHESSVKRVQIPVD